MIASIALVWAVSLAQASAPSPLIGTWVEKGGSTRARIALCPGASDVLCASVVGSGETVLTGLKSTGAGQWRGRYVADGMDLAATVRLTGPDVVAMTACRLVLCQTVTYRRTR